MDEPIVADPDVSRGRRIHARAGDGSPSLMTDRTTQTEDEWTIGKLLAWTQGHFVSRGIDDARLCAELLLAKTLECEKIILYTRLGESPSAEQRGVFREMVRAAADHHPIAYLIGRKEFYSLEFEVTPDVLIPRPETELIVEHALSWCQSNPSESYLLLDVGTGCGCIPITIAKRNPSVSAIATDISEGALVVAGRNAERHGVEQRVTLHQADMLNLPGSVIQGAAGGFDIITSNPPYVAERERESLPRNVLDYEPNLALFSGEDGLDAYRRLARDIGKLLRPAGALLLEIGEGQADAVTGMFEAAGLVCVGRFNDLAGTPRTLQLTLPE